jgi:hypothetical protein
MPTSLDLSPIVARRRTLRVVIVLLALASIAYGAAVTLAITSTIPSAVGWIVIVAGAVLLPAVLFIVRRRM